MNDVNVLRVQTLGRSGPEKQERIAAVEDAFRKGKALNRRALATKTGISDITC